MSDNTSFLQSTSDLLLQLKADQVPVFGRMSAQHMVEHLVLLFKVSRGRIKAPLSVPEEQLEKRRAWLMSDKQMRPGAKMPGTGDETPLPPLRFESLSAAQKEYEKELATFYSYYEAEENKDSKEMHPMFGLLNLAEWEQFHQKHIKHHLRQFELYQ